MHLATEPNLAQEFIRTNWVSRAAQDVWEPVFRDCNLFFQYLERESVTRGLREVVIQSCAADKLDKMTADVLNQNLFVMPLEKIGDTGIYQSSGVPYDPQKPWMYRVALGRFNAVKEVANGYRDRDDVAIGKALGYPDCCIDFFNSHWRAGGWIDTTYPMSAGKPDHKKWSPYCNILLRWLGIRFVSHLPCSFNCEETMRLGSVMHQLAIDLGHRTIADQMLEVLSWPIEWSGLHGIGLITTPVCRITVRTDMLKQRRTVRLHSKVYPKEMASGLKFPFVKDCPNGFYREDDENRAHNLLLDVIRHAAPKSVIDLGCGDSTLLHKIARDFSASICGVDTDHRKYPDIVGDIFQLDDFPRDFDLALISRNRLKENPEGWIRLLYVIHKRCKMLLLYSYNGDDSNLDIPGFEASLGTTNKQTTADLYDKIETTVP